VIGQKIKERRQELGLSLRDLGAKTGLSASFISQLENDLTEMSINSLQKIALALNVPMFTFLKRRRTPGAGGAGKRAQAPQFSEPSSPI